MDTFDAVRVSTKNPLALTGYTANTSPTKESGHDKAKAAGVPEGFLLPNGYPDVRMTHHAAGLCTPHLPVRS